MVHFLQLHLNTAFGFSVILLFLNTAAGAEALIKALKYLGYIAALVCQLTAPEILAEYLAGLRLNAGPSQCAMPPAGDRMSETFVSLKMRKMRNKHA